MDTRAVDEAVVEAMSEYRLVGVGVATISDGELTHAKGFGMADAAARRPVTPDTVFRIGSLSKTITAIGLMRLWEDGLFRLDDPVNEHLEDFRIEHRDPSVPPVTFRHILTHTAGIGEVPRARDFLRPAGVLGVKTGRAVPSESEFYGPVLRAELPPGTKWAYSNHAFGALAQVIEDISGESFERYMLDRVFEPLGMHHSDYDRSERVRAGVATGYKVRRGRAKTVTDRDMVARGAGAVYSTVADMARYATALVNGGTNECGTVLEPDTLELMFSPHFVLEGRPVMGLAFNLQDWEGHRIVEHGGNWFGFDSSMYVAPDDRAAVLVFSNTNSFLGQAVLAKRLLRDRLGVADPGELPRPGIPERPDLWPELVGIYRPTKGFLTNFRAWAMLGGGVEVLVHQDHLALRGRVGPSRKPLRLYPVQAQDPHVFRLVFRKVPFDVWFTPSDDGDEQSVTIGELNQRLVWRRRKYRRR